VVEHIAAVRERGAAVLAVSFASAELGAHYARDLKLVFPLLADPERQSYRAWGLPRGSARQVWGPRVLWGYLRRLLAGHRWRVSSGGQDLYQLGGDFVVDAEGKVAWVRVSRDPDDRPSIAEVLAALDQAVAQAPG